MGDKRSKATNLTVTRTPPMKTAARIPPANNWSRATNLTATRIRAVAADQRLTAEQLSELLDVRESASY